MSARAAAYAVTTALATLAFVGSGIANLMRVEHVASDMLHLGYPGYFMTILGAFKVAGALVVAAPGLPRLKEWAYAGMIFDLCGASLSRAFVGDGAAMVIVPLAIAAVVAISWALRPAGRLLPPSPFGAAQGSAESAARAPR